MNADGSGQRQLSRTGVAGHFVRWTAAGRQIIFRCPCNGTPKVMRMSVDGGELEDLAGDESWLSHVPLS